MFQMRGGEEMENVTTEPRHFGLGNEMENMVFHQNKMENMVLTEEVRVMDRIWKVNFEDR